MPDIDGLTLVRLLAGQPRHTRDAHDRPLHQGGAGGQGARPSPWGRTTTWSSCLTRSSSWPASVITRGLHRPCSSGTRLIAGWPRASSELASEIDQAANYVRSLLPDKLAGRADSRRLAVRTPRLSSAATLRLPLARRRSFRHVPAGCQRARRGLVAVARCSAMNALRAQTLPLIDFRQPSQVLAGLNNAFQMDQQKGKYFTIWYGVYLKPAQAGVRRRRPPRRAAARRTNASRCPPGRARVAGPLDRQRAGVRAAIGSVYR